MAAVLAAFLVPGAAVAQDDLSLRFVESGMKAFRERRYAEAATDLRVARFLTLDKPARHLDALARLAVAEDAAGEIPARTATLARFLEVERRFGDFEAASLEPDLRERFLAILVKNIGRERILEVPTLAAEFGFIAARPTRRPSPTPTVFTVPAPTETPPVAQAPQAAPVIPSPTSTVWVTEAGRVSATPAATETPALPPSPTVAPAITPTRTLPPPTPRPPTSSPTATSTSTSTPSETPTPRQSPTSPATRTSTPQPSATAAPSRTHTPTPLPHTPSPTRTATFTATMTRTPRPSSTPTATETTTPLPSATVAPSRTHTPTPLPHTPSSTRTATSTPTPTTPRPSPTLGLRFVAPGSVDTPPRPVEMVMPIYPERALKERVRGLVVLKVLVAEDGAPVRITVEKGARKDLTAAALAAARQWRFEPARKDGRPVRTFTTLRFPFEGVQFARTPFPRDAAPTAPQPTSTPPLARSEERWREQPTSTPRPPRSEERWREQPTSTPRPPRSEERWRERTPRPTRAAPDATR